MSQLAISEFWEVTPVLSNSSSNCLILANGSRFSSGINSLSKSVIPPLPAVIRFASFPPSKKISVQGSTPYQNQLFLPYPQLSDLLLFLHQRK